MARRQPANVYASREAVDALLAGSPTRYQLLCRRNALQRLAEDCERFFPIPALVESLRNDIARLSDRILPGEP